MPLADFFAQHTAACAEHQREKLPGQVSRSGVFRQGAGHGALQGEQGADGRGQRDTQWHEICLAEERCEGGQPQPEVDHGAGARKPEGGQGLGDQNNRTPAVRLWAHGRGGKSLERTAGLDVAQSHDPGGDTGQNVEKKLLDDSQRHAAEGEQDQRLRQQRPDSKGKESDNRPTCFG